MFKIHSVDEEQLHHQQITQGERREGTKRCLICLPTPALLRHRLRVQLG